MIFPFKGVAELLGKSHTSLSHSITYKMYSSFSQAIATKIESLNTCIIPVNCICNFPDYPIKSLVRMDIITSHVNADFDALACAVAAQKLYPEAMIVFPGSMEKRVRDFMEIFNHGEKA